ncbi:MAG: ATP-binding cassette domain-containing protein [Nitrososphaeraceae archaeon]
MIILKNLTKIFDNFTAVDNISLTIKENEVFGLLGQNGAGKTTTIHMLATLIKPTSGTASINDYDIIKHPSHVRENIGIVFQAPSSDDMLTGYENLKIYSYLYNVSDRDREKRIIELLDLVGLKERKDDLVKKYSGGMRRRLEIARGLIHRPKVIFLDEPTLGLDPNSRKSMWKYIQELVKEEKITVILTTHYMEEADFLCDRIGFINKGRIIATDTPANLKSTINGKMGGDIIKLKFKNSETNANNVSNQEQFKSIIKTLNMYDFINNFKIEENILILSVKNASYNLPILLKVLNNVESVQYSETTLNDVFHKFTNEDINEHPEGGFMEKFAQYG